MLMNDEMEKEKKMESHHYQLQFHRPNLFTIYSWNFIVIMHTNLLQNLESS